MASGVELKREFEKRAAELVVQLNELETICGQLIGTVGGPAVTAARQLGEARIVVQTVQSRISSSLAHELTV